MQLVYRGVPYESYPPTFELSLTEIHGIYRGVRSVHKTTVLPVPPTRGLQLSYRGVSYLR